MKKMFAVLTAVIIAAGAWAGNSSTPHPNEKATATFEKEFTGATDVQWTNIKDVTIARFKLNNEQMRAYFNEDGVLAVLQRDVKAEQLTYPAAKALQELAKKQTILSIAEVIKEGEMYYLISTEDSKNKTIYHLSAAGTTNVIQKKKKK